MKRPAPRITRRAVNHTRILAIFVEENIIFSSPRTVTFEVGSAPDTGLTHELVVLKTDLAADKLPVKNGQVSESRLKKMGEVEDIDPGKNKRLTLKLAPGRYVLICNTPGHYAMGLHTSLLVTP